MQIYQSNSQWFVVSSGGYCNNNIIERDHLGPFTEKPIPVAKWKEDGKSSSYGNGISIYTRFNVDGKGFTLEEYSWCPAHGYSWEEQWEQLIPDSIYPMDNKLPPVLGESFKWSDSGWIICEHPQQV